MALTPLGLQEKKNLTRLVIFKDGGVGSKNVEYQ